MASVFIGEVDFTNKQALTIRKVIQ